MGSLGARVGVNYARDAAAAEATVALIHGAGGQATALRADVSDLAAAEAAGRGDGGAPGPLDVLVVNHGIWKHAPLAELTAEQWDGDHARQPRTARTRSAAPPPAGWSRAAAARSCSSPPPPASAARRSTRTTRPRRARSSRFTKSLAAELGAARDPRERGRAGLGPHRHDAPRLRGTRGTARVREDPARPPGAAGGDRRPVAFLASDLASYMYGEVLAVNGGAVMAD